MYVYLFVLWWHDGDFQIFLIQQQLLGGDTGTGPTTTQLLYLSQEGKMLNNQMGTLCFPSTALSTDDDTLKQKENIKKGLF